MPRPKTPAERGIESDHGKIKVGDVVRFHGGRFLYRVVEVRKGVVKAVGEYGSELSTEPDCLEVVDG